jgi:Leucine Rich repeat
MHVPRGSAAMVHDRYDNFCARSPGRNWLRLSLRSLLVLFTLLAVWLAIVANRAREQRRIVTALSQSPGAMLMYDYEWDVSAGGEIPRPRPLGPPPGPSWLRSWLGDEYFTTVIGLFLTGGKGEGETVPTKEQLKLVHDLRGLRVLSLEKSSITDAGLSAIADQTDLVYLWLDDTAISDSGLAHLRQMRNLKYLYIRNSRVTDAGIDALKQDLPGARICYGNEGVQKIK